MARVWMKNINEILRAHRFRQGDYFLRFQATLYPKPTIAIAVYYKGAKVFERPIRRLGEFIEDLSDVLDILKSVRVEETTGRRQSRRRRTQEKGTKQQRRRRRGVEEETEEPSETNEEYDDEEEEENTEEDEENEDREIKRS